MIYTTIFILDDYAVLKESRFSIKAIKEFISMMVLLMFQPMSFKWDLILIYPFTDTLRIH